PVLKYVKGFAHITGGGLLENTPRILPEGLAAHFDRSTWEIPPLFRLIQHAGEVPEMDMFRTFNMGLGAVLAVAAEHVATLRQSLPEARVVGEVVASAAGTPRVIIS